MQTPNGSSQVPPAYSPQAAVSAPVDPRVIPPPPRLHWGWVLALTMLTRSYFNAIWMIVQANWVKRVTGRSEALYWTIAHVAALPVIMILAVMVGFTMAFVPGSHTTNGDSGAFVFGVGAIAVLLILGTYIKAAFTLRAALEDTPIGIPLGGVMTFLFSGIYFQYFLRDYVVLSPEEAYGSMPPPPSYVPPTSPEPRS